MCFNIIQLHLKLFKLFDIQNSGVTNGVAGVATCYTGPLKTGRGAKKLGKERERGKKRREREGKRKRGKEKEKGGRKRKGKEEEKEIYG